MKRYVVIFVICFLFGFAAAYTSAKTSVTRKTERADTCGFPLFVPVELRKEFNDFKDITEDGWREFLKKLSDG